ncbi:hypothetical protein, partial [Roseiconus lacunae]|uniref:hypothetical protein n=1 Tax=Roseiconus lacunae TaxID=2605694 RepID=UPI001F2B991B
MTKTNVAAIDMPKQKTEAKNFAEIFSDGVDLNKEVSILPAPDLGKRGSLSFTGRNRELQKTILKFSRRQVDGDTRRPYLPRLTDRQP